MTNLFMFLLRLPRTTFVFNLEKKLGKSWDLLRISKIDLVLRPGNSLAVKRNLGHMLANSEGR